MINRITVLALLCYAGYVTGNVSAYAQNTQPETPVLAEETQDTRFAKALKERVSDKSVYTPYVAHKMYQAKLESQKDFETKSGTIQKLSEMYKYTPEELSNISEKYDENPPFKNMLSETKREDIYKLIQNNPDAAFYQILKSGEMDASYLPSYKEDTGPLLTAPKTNPDFPDETDHSTPSVASIIKNIPSEPTIIFNKPNEKKRLGKKSYNIHPDNLNYEKDK